jgi:outer membrane usher protein
MHRGSSHIILWSRGATLALCAAVMSASALAAPGEVKTAQAVQVYSLTLPLIFGNVYLGDVPVAASSDGKISVNTERFTSLLGQRISADMIAKVKEVAGGHAVVSIEALSVTGLLVVYDSAKLELHVSIPVQLQGGQSISAYDRTSLGEPSRATIAPAQFSGSATFIARQSYEWSPAAVRGWDPANVSMDIAANVFGPEGAYLFVQGEYDGAADRPFRRGDIVLVHDDPDDAVRYSAGDVTPVSAGLQGAPILGGVSVQRQYGELQPFANIRPSGLFRFSLERASTVDVVVNGVTIRTLRLDAGQYDLKDFPFFNGLNEVELYVVDEFGRRLLAKFEEFFSTKMLNEGVSEFGATLGYLQSRDADQQITYGQDLLTFSGYGRFGLTDSVTVGANFQGNDAQWMGGVEIGWASPIGTLGFVTGLSDIDGLSSGQSYLVSYEASADQLWVLEHPQLNLEYLYSSEFFSPVGQLVPNQPSQYDVRGRFSTRLPMDLGLGLSASFTRGRDAQPDVRRFALSVSYNLGFADITGSDEQVVTEDAPDENRFLLSISLPLGDKELTRASFDSTNDQYQLEYTRFAHDELGDVGFRGAISRDDDKLTGSGQFAYNANRFSAVVEHDTIADTALDNIQSQQSSYTLGTQIAFAGGDVTFGHPVGPRFAIVAEHETLDDRNVGVRRGDGTAERNAETDFLGPALVSAGTAYQPQKVMIDIQDLPLGYDPGPTQYDVFPGPASGYSFRVGSNASHIVIGTLLGADGKPVALQGGEMQSLTDHSFKAVPVFTNSTGRFVAEGLAPGRYRLVLGAQMNMTVTVVVPDQAIGIINLGVVHLDPAAPPASVQASR